MSTLKLCKKYFGTADVYQLFEVTKDATSAEIKKSYYKLSMQVHPDRVPAQEKDVATEKFKVLSKLYQVLSDKDKRACYDQYGTIDDDDGDTETKLTSWLELWRSIFKAVTDEDISNYEKGYIGSEMERSDMKKAYLSGKGCINHMMNEVPFLRVEDEPRMQTIIGELIASGDVPDYKCFTNESKQKRSRRHKKYARESREAEEIKKRLDARNKGSLGTQLMEREKARAGHFDSLMSRLIEKYGGDDDSDPIDLDMLGSSGRKKTAKGGAGKKTAKKSTGVKEGRVHKRKN